MKDDDNSRRRRPRPVPRGHRRAGEDAGPPEGAASKPVVYEVAGVGYLLLGIILIFAPFIKRPVTDALTEGLKFLFGTWGVYGVAGALLLLGITLLVHLKRVRLTRTTLGVILVFLVVISLLQLAQPHPWDSQRLATGSGWSDRVAYFTRIPGGLVGAAIAGASYALLGGLAWALLVAAGLCGVALLSDQPLWVTFLTPFRWLWRAAVLGGQALFGGAAAERRREARAERTARVAELQEEERRRRGRPLSEEGADPFALARDMNLPPVKPTRLPSGRDLPPSMQPPGMRPPEPGGPPSSAAMDPPSPLQGVPSETPGQLRIPDTVLRAYQLPPIDLLTTLPRVKSTSKETPQSLAAKLEETLNSFGIDAKVVNIEYGPRVTRFELLPPPGVRISRITNLADDITLALSALDVRVEAPVPGKGVVGIEVPNKELTLVSLREMVECRAFQESRSPITFVLGRDVAGTQLVADLGRMPHLLIAGATNSGKSVCINSLICSILMRATPQQVKFLMVDPKRVELSLYQNIPHLIAPVAHDAKVAAGLLRWAIREMEGRYEVFADKGVRDVRGFNEAARAEGLEPYPFIVIVIDELADLMQQAAAEFEGSICRIAQLARATGIHLVVATQRPSVNVITGIIKANIPSRIAFSVASQVDSRTILDMNGAERLVGMGDMLYLPVDAAKPARIQGAFVSELEINRIVEYVKAQGKPYFSNDIVRIEEDALHGGEDGAGTGYGDAPDDELYQQALDFVRVTKYASTSMLQRKFRIGYTRAARLMDDFEAKGYVGPGQGSKPREVIFAPPSSVVGPQGRPAEDESEDDEGIRDPFPEGKQGNP